MAGFGKASVLSQCIFTSSIGRGQCLPDHLAATTLNTLSNIREQPGVKGEKSIQTALLDLLVCMF